MYALVVSVLCLLGPTGAVRPSNPGTVVGGSVPLGRRPQRFVEQSVVGSTITTVGGILALGEYYVNIKVGGQMASVDLDTGSSTLAIPDSHCSNCIKTTGLNPYNSAQSNSGTFAPVMCGTDACSSQFCVSRLTPVPPGGTSGFTTHCLLDISYGDGSGLGGALATDVVSLPSVQGPVLAAPAVFGRVLNNRGFVSTGSTQAPGIIGLAYNALNCAPLDNKYCSNCDIPCFPTVLDQIVAQNRMRYMFGMCMTDNGGAWDVGYADLNKMSAPIQWVPVIPEADGRRYFWRVDLRSISQSGRSLNYDPTSAERTIVDSGTTLMVVPAGFISALRSLWVQLGLPKATSHFGSTSCCNAVSLTANQLAAYPPMEFQFSTGLSLSVPASKYLIALGGGSYQLGMSIGSSDIILGDTFMQQFYTVFDMDNNNVGFSVLASDSCDANIPVAASTDGQTSSEETNKAGIGAGIAVAAFVACAAVAFAYYRKKKTAQTSAVSMRSPGYSVVTTTASDSNAASVRRAPAVPTRGGQRSGYAAVPQMPSQPGEPGEPDAAASVPFAAHEWKTYSSPEGYVYYFNERTGETTWQKPPGMP